MVGDTHPVHLRWTVWMGLGTLSSLQAILLGMAYSASMTRMVATQASLAQFAPLVDVLRRDVTAMGTEQQALGARVTALNAAQVEREAWQQGAAEQRLSILAAIADLKHSCRPSGISPQSWHPPPRSGAVVHYIREEVVTDQAPPEAHDDDVMHARWRWWPWQ